MASTEYTMDVQEKDLAKAMHIKVQLHGRAFGFFDWRLKVMAALIRLAGWVHHGEISVEILSNQDQPDASPIIHFNEESNCGAYLPIADGPWHYLIRYPLFGVIETTTPWPGAYPAKKREDI